MLLSLIIVLERLWDPNETIKLVIYINDQRITWLLKCFEIPFTGPKNVKTLGINLAKHEQDPRTSTQKVPLRETGGKWRERTAEGIR